MKNKQALSLLLTANIISGFAQGISMLSIPWYFTNILKASSTFSMIYMAITFATIFWSLYAGSLIDRYSRKRIFLIISWTGGIILSFVSIIGFYLGYVPMALIALVFTTTIFIYNIHYPALYAFGQEISERSNYGKMSSYFEIQGQATTVVAGAIGALLLSGTQNKMINLLGIHLTLPFDIKKWELHEIFLMDAITYFIAIVLISLINYIPTETSVIDTGKVKDRIKMGMDYLRKNPLIFIFGNATFSIFVILLIQVHLLLPLYVDRHLEQGADVYASAEIYYAFGALLAGFGIRYMFRKTNSVKAIVLLMVLTTAVLFVCAFTKSVAVFFSFSAIIGLTNAGTRVLRVTYLFNRIPNNMMGRAGSVFQMINILLRSIFLGIFAIPFFSQGSNVTWAYFIGGVFILLSIVPLLAKYKELNALSDSIVNG